MDPGLLWLVSDDRMFEKSKNITWLETSVKIMSSMDEQNKADIEKMAEELM